MASERSRSRPPTSRFQEGSMNDRTSAAPPAQFLGPDQLREYEHQFCTGPSWQHEAGKQRRDRPLSATAQLQATTIPPQFDGQGQQHTVTHKKSTGFFGRVRDALFNRGGGVQGQVQTPKQQEVRRKHSSLQEPLQHPPSRPDYLHLTRTQSDINIPQMLPNPRGAADRPSREEVMASYNQLVATGFFQSHAIQSTRHAGPAAGRQTLVMPAIPASPHTPRRVSSVHAPTSCSSPVPGHSHPYPQGRTSREYSGAAPLPPHTSLSATCAIPDLHTKDSLYTLRGRKRTRISIDDPRVTSPESQISSSAPTTYLAQPLKRVAKKLRKMPSLGSPAADNSSAAAVSTSIPAAQPRYQNAADGIVRLVPSISSGGTLYPNERAVRLRSPSPAATPEVVMTDGGGSNSRHTNRGDGSGTRRPRRTFSGTLTGSLRGRGSRTSEANRLHKRGTSAMRSSDSAATALGQWQRVSLEDSTIVHRDSGESTRRSADRRARMGGDVAKPKTHQEPPSPLQVVPDANRGIPSMPKVPERWHGSGKAYHLRDRGSRAEVSGVRRSEDGGGSGKENAGAGAGANWDSVGLGAGADVDADGDVDMYVHKTVRHTPQRQHWRIGKAL